jgi:putative RNA 2'-phosphotransferase
MAGRREGACQSRRAFRCRRRGSRHAAKIDQDRKALEKLLRYVLDTAPHEYGLFPGDGGWYQMKDVIASLRGEEGFRRVSEVRIMELVNEPGGVSPFEVDGALLRLKPQFQKGPPPLPENLVMPKELWCGLRLAGWHSASEHGLKPRRPRETRIPLFTDKGQALAVAARSMQDPVPVKVLAARAREKGVVITPFAETLWLADEVPPEFLSGPVIKPVEEKDARKGKAKGPAQEESPMKALGFPLPEPQALKGKKKGRFSDSPDWKTQTRRDRRGGPDPGKGDGKR